MDAYDVIIIGTGAGGGTMARHLAPSGKKILLLERGDWLPREPQNWLAQDVFVDGATFSGRVRRQGEAVPAQIHYSSAAPRSSTAPRSTACAGRIRRAADGISPAWPISYDELEPTTPGEQMYPEYGARGGIRPGLGRRPTHTRQCHTSRGSSSWPTSAAAGYHPFQRPPGSSSMRTRPTAPAFAAPTATAFLVHCTRRPTPRCWVCGRRSSTRT